MAGVIGEQHGAEAVRKRLNTIDPGKAAYDKMFGAPTAANEGTVRKLIAGHNEVHQPGGLADVVADLRRDLSRRPF